MVFAWSKPRSLFHVATPVQMMANPMKRVLLTCIVALAFGVSDTYAQLPGPKVYVGAGASMPNTPTGFSDAYKTGLNAVVGLGLPLFPFTEGVVAARYDRFALDGDVSGVSVDDAFSVLSGSFNLKINPPLPKLSPYAIGGLGVYRTTTGALTVSGGDVELEGETNLGANLGVGLAFDLVPLVDLFVEPQYVVIFTEGENTTYYPVRAGLAIGL